MVILREGERGRRVWVYACVLMRVRVRAHMRAASHTCMEGEEAVEVEGMGRLRSWNTSKLWERAPQVPQLSVLCSCPSKTSLTTDDCCARACCHASSACPQALNPLNCVFLLAVIQPLGCCCSMSCCICQRCAKDTCCDMQCLMRTAVHLETSAEWTAWKVAVHGSTP